MRVFGIPPCAIPRLNAYAPRSLRYHALCPSDDSKPGVYKFLQSVGSEEALPNRRFIMSWMQRLYDTYEQALRLTDLPRDARRLFAWPHFAQNAHINVVIDGEGHFLRHGF